MIKDKTTYIIYNLDPSRWSDIQFHKILIEIKSHLNDSSNICMVKIYDIELTIQKKDLKSAYALKIKQGNSRPRYYGESDLNRFTDIIKDYVRVRGRQLGEADLGLEEEV